eukprot:scaffold123514_cov54-Attheya_sp.AAC.2
MAESGNPNALLAPLIFFFLWILVVVVCIWYNKRSMVPLVRRDENSGPDIESSREHSIANTQEHPQEYPTYFVTENRRSQIRENMLTKNIEDNENASSTSAAMEINDKDSSGKLSSRSWHSTVSSAKTQPIGVKSECPICLSGYDIGDTMCWSKNEKCNHAFHEECILQWLEKHRECPLCRTDILGPDDEGEA